MEWVNSLISHYRSFERRLITCNFFFCFINGRQSLRNKSTCIVIVRYVYFKCSSSSVSFRSLPGTNICHTSHLFTGFIRAHRLTLERPCEIRRVLRSTINTHFQGEGGVETDIVDENIRCHHRAPQTAISDKEQLLGGVFVQS